MFSNILLWTRQDYTIKEILNKMCSAECLILIGKGEYVLKTCEKLKYVSMQLLVQLCCVVYKLVFLLASKDKEEQPT